MWKWGQPAIREALTNSGSTTSTISTFPHAALRDAQQHGPTIKSEFQAGWLAAPEDQLPRPSAPSSTTLALYQLLALGVKGIIQGPSQEDVSAGRLGSAL